LSEAQEALTLALQALSHKERSVAELGNWLRERGVEESAAEQALAGLMESGALDDTRFAARYAEDKRELSGWGRERIRTALLERGVPAEDVEAALAADDDLAETERAADLLRDRALPLADEAGRHRALGLLARRGYSSDVAYEAVRLVERGG
jgi:regulatory protein